MKKRIISVTIRMLWEILLYLWQLPQNLVGLLFLLVLKGETRHRLGSIRFYFLDTFPGGITLGEYILVGTRQELTVRHEYGHVLQSRMLGPLYLLVIGLPSVLWAWLHRYIAPDKSYYWFYTERWADRLGRGKR